MTPTASARLFAITGLLLLAACGGAGSSASKPPSPGSSATDPAPHAPISPSSTVARAPQGDGPWPLLRATGGGSAMIVDGVGLVASFGHALVSADGSTVIATEPAGEDTRLRW